jgi:NAD(P)-dependent dehydrogenase (short-subunit alcohol dehydrogenase family)
VQSDVQGCDFRISDGLRVVGGKFIVAGMAGTKGWALVLGASSGFGGATAVELARGGWNIAGVHLDRRSTIENAEQVKADVRTAGAEALFFNVNAAAEDKRAEVLDALAEVAAPGSVRVLLHSLAFGSMLPLVGDETKGSIRQKQIEMTLDVMASSLVYWSQELVWRGLMGEGGRIFAMSSAGSTRAQSGYGVISAAKAALEAFIRQLALELGPRGITANTIRAGVTETAAFHKIPGSDGIAAKARAQNPTGRLTTPGEVASAIALLTEPGASWISGNVIGVDGGEDIAG